MTDALNELNRAINDTDALRALLIDERNEHAGSQPIDEDEVEQLANDIASAIKLYNDNLAYTDMAEA